MNETEFYQNCEETLSNLAEEIEAKDKDAKLDVDYSDGILNIIDEETEKTFVINRHAASMKIWYSSPFTGADYFSFNNGKWLDSREKELKEKLFFELKEYIL